MQLNTGGYTQVALQYGGVVPGAKGEGLTDEISLTNLVLEYDFGWATLLSSSAWVEDDSEWNNGVTAFTSGLPLGRRFTFSSEAIFEELRLVSQLDGPWQYILGLYYEDIDAQSNNPIYAFTDLAITALGGVNFTNDPLLFQIHTQDNSLKQLAFFGEVSYDFTEQFELTVGVRRFDYERNSISSIDAGAAGFTTQLGEFEETGTSFKVNLSYEPNADALVYGQFAEGFRLGNTIFPPDLTRCDVNNDGILEIGRAHV